MSITIRKEYLQKWINPKHLNDKNISKYKKTFSSSKPFEHLELPDFFIEEKAVEIESALLQEKFILKESDLFTFLQTYDLRSTNNLVLASFNKFLSSKEFIRFMYQITGTSLKNKIDMSGTIYENTHHLLPHDDRLEKRKIAYFYYFSTMKKGEGGSLQLYVSRYNKPTKISKEIMPRFNTFAFFKVSKRSYHQVEEVTKEKQRIAISGWFHGNK